ncbi:MAG TPA: hypothetical protein VLF94_06565, partial [Chlamydiales bacterium]|nr:hypothetical protein [Chlamydiales bacterium]
MIDETNSCFDGLDRTFIDLSSKLAEPFCWAYGMLRYRFVSPLDPGKFDNTTSQVREIATRVLIFATAALAFAFAAPHIVIVAALAGAGSQIFRSIGFALQKDRFTHVRGLAPEKVLQNGQASTLVWGICGEYGGLSYKGGVVHWRSRLDKIVEKIETVDPDLIVLREIDDTALAEALIARLQGRYAHFFTHIAGSSCNKTNGCMVITKCAVSHFSHHDLSNQAGFEMIELKASPDDASPCVRFMGTELNPAKECEESRVNQIAEIIHALAKETRVLPTFVVGTNAYRD